MILERRTMDYLLWWKCPNCGTKVDFYKQMQYVFSENNEADFTPEEGLWFHTIFCPCCNANWKTGISKIDKSSCRS